MKLVEMKQIKGERVGDIDLFVAFDCDIERELYEQAIDDSDSGYEAGLLEGLLSMGLNDHYTDDDIFYYFTIKGEDVPDIGERWGIDDLIYERVK